MQEVSLRYVASGPGAMFTDGDWVEAPHIKDSGNRLIQTGNVGIGEYREKGYRYISDKSFHALGCTEVLPGDVLICRLAYPVGRACLAPDLAHRMLTSVDVCVCRPNPTIAESRYLVYYLSSRPYLGEIEAIARGGTRQRISRDQLGSVRIPLPPVETQRAIADYLDAETARIDALIAKKRRLIEVLQERFEAEVFHLVTRGLDSRAELRASGIDWVGDIPEHWGLPTVSANFDLQLGKMLSAEAASGPDQYPYVRNVNVQWDRFDLEDLATMHFSEADRRRCELRPGDLLVCEGGEVGRAAVWQAEMDECYFQKAIHRVRPRGSANSRFLMYCLRAAAKQAVFSVEGNQSTIVHLTGEQLRVHRFPWPPPDEQGRIVGHLDRVALMSKTVRSDLSAQITLLAEHRQALITAAVTGELEVAA